MIVKQRQKSIELQVLRVLDRRMTLLPKEKQHYLNLEKGLEGEKRLDKMLEGLQEERLILNDLLFEVNKTTFQIDSLMIAQDTLSFYEVKNLEGEYYYQADSFYSTTGTEIKNPLHQLQRSKTLLRQVLQNAGLHYPIQAKLIYINPNFTLFQAPRDLPMILPTQISSWIKQLDSKPSNLTPRHKKLAQALLHEHRSIFPFTQLPAYHYEQLQKGIPCAKCGSFSLASIDRKLLCNECGHIGKTGVGILRSVKDFRILFPDEKITTKTIHEWCKEIVSPKMIRKVLMENYRHRGKGKYCYYFDNEDDGM